MNTAGTLAEHFGMLFEDALVDSSCSDRRTRLPWQVFSELMQRALRPLVCRRRQLIPVRIDPDDTIVIPPEGRGRFLAAWTRIGSTPQDEPAIRRLLDVEKPVLTGSAEGLVPNLVPLESTLTSQ